MTFMRKISQFWLIFGLLFALIAGILAWSIARHNYRQTLDESKSGIAIVAQSRAQALGQWATQQGNLVEALANNPAVQLYVSALVLDAKDDISRGQAAYLRNLLQSSAERNGFLAPQASVPANVPRPLSSGLAIVSLDGRILMEIGGPTPSPADMLAQKPKMPFSINGAAPLAAGPSLRFLAPLLGPGDGRVIAYLYAVRALDPQARNLLIQPGEAPGFAQSAIVRQSRPGVYRYIVARSGIQEGAEVPNDSVAMAAMQNPGTVVQINAAQEERLLAIAHIVPNTDWVLLRVHPAHFILQAAQSQAQLLFWGLAAGFGLLFSLGFLVHQRRLAARQVRLADEEARARRFLSLIADQQPTAIAVLEANGNARFVNATLKHWSNADIGSNLAVLFGLAATQLQEMVDHARKGHEAHAIINDGTRRLSVRVSNFTATHMPPNPERSTSQPPQPPSGDVMIVAEDVTELLSARERREAELTALVRALTGLIDARDPGSAHHSARVARVAAAIAKVQNMGSLAEETVYTAGQLMNLGKILIPRSLLTKEGPLSPEERERVQAALARSADVLKNIPFSGPVGDTIANINNPEASHNPLVQIVRLANAYVGMVSPRAHRAPLTPEAALAELRRDPVLSPPVSALAHWLDNLGGRRALEAEQVDS